MAAWRAGRVFLILVRPLSGERYEIYGSGAAPWPSVPQQLALQPLPLQLLLPVAQTGSAEGGAEHEGETNAQEA